MKHPQRMLTGIVVAFSAVTLLLSGCTQKPATSSTPGGATTTRAVTTATTRVTTASTISTSTALFTIPTTVVPNITGATVTTKSTGAA